MATGRGSDEAALFFLWLQEGRVYPVNDVSFLVFFDAAEAAERLFGYAHSFVVFIGNRISYLIGSVLSTPVTFYVGGHRQ
jgi:hypothetical protein